MVLNNRYTKNRTGSLLAKLAFQVLQQFKVRCTKLCAVFYQLAYECQAMRSILPMV